MKKIVVVKFKYFSIMRKTEKFQEMKNENAWKPEIRFFKKTIFH